MASIEKRKSSDGSAVYRVRVRKRGYPSRSASFARLTDARRWAAETEAAIASGKYFRTPKADKRTLAEAIRRYTDEDLTTLADARNRVRQLAYWNRELGAITLTQLCNDPDLIADAARTLGHTTTRGRRISQVTVKRYLAALSRLFSRAGHWGWVRSNPVRLIQKPKERPGRVRFLDDDERRRLLAATRDSKDPFLHTIVLVALTTGGRLGEIMWLRWPDVNLARGTVTFHETKNKETRTVPLVGEALEAVKEMSKVRRLDTDLLFAWSRPDKPKSIETGWRRALRAAGIENFRFHDLRHSAASYLAMSGATPSEIAAVLGHKTLAMVKRYAHLSDPHTADLMRRMNERFLS